MIENLALFIASTYAIFRWATMSTQHAGDLARSFNLSRYVIGFLVVAVIAILPETFISVNTAIKWIPEYGLATLFGSNIADLTLVFAIIVFVAGRSLKVSSEVLKSHVIYPFMLLLPLLLGWNGHYSRVDGLVLILAGCIFYYFTLKNGSEETVEFKTDGSNKKKSILMLLFSMMILLVGSHFMITSSLSIAESLGVNSIIIWMLVVWLGTTVPELCFAIQSVRKKDDSLAIGDILGTVLADATIVVGIIALIAPFEFPVRIIYFTGVVMLTASCILFYLMKSGKSLTRREANVLFLFWVFFASLEIFLNK